MFRLMIEPELEPFLHRRIERIKEADPHASPDERTKEFAEISGCGIWGLNIGAG